MIVFGIEFPPAAIAASISAVIAACALTIGWLQWRERQLRQDDVLRWANEGIRNLQTLYIMIFLGEPTFDAATLRATLTRIAVDISVLVEQGRLYFRNAAHPTYGADRHPAYRGYRPMILDPLVVAHQIATRWDDTDAAGRERMVAVAQDCVRSFVSLAQREVGRSRTAHEDTARRGEGERLEALMARVAPERIEQIKRANRLSL